MNVVTYMQLISDAQIICESEQVVSLKAMQDVFGELASWTAINNEQSDLVKFLDILIKSETDYSVDKLRCLGLLWCYGSVNDKANVLFNFINEDRFASKEDSQFTNIFCDLINLAIKIGNTTQKEFD